MGLDLGPFENWEWLFNSYTVSMEFIASQNEKAINGATNILTINISSTLKSTSFI